MTVACQCWGLIQGQASTGQKILVLQHDQTESMKLEPVKALIPHIAHTQISAVHDRGEPVCVANSIAKRGSVIPAVVLSGPSAKIPVRTRIAALYWALAFQDPFDVQTRLLPTDALSRRLLAPSLAALLVACSGGDNGDGAGSNPGETTTGLSALPNPPLTAAPSADDEPVTDTDAFHTASNFAVVREAAEPLPEAPVIALTEADFALGLPEAVVTVPAGVDSTANAAPFFEDLDNQRVVAGETLEIRFVPRDPEGELPGMFPQEIPQGGSFIDNFDGTRSLIWQPLQADIGITSFTAVAIDPAESAYRTSQTVLIAVDAPTDPATIPNVAPGIKEVLAFTVRAGDPVVIEIEGVDRNGTLPTLELVNAPAGASLLPHPRFEEIHVLRVVPAAAGELTIDVLVRDAVDPSLTAIESIRLIVETPANFVRSGARLRDLAAGQGVSFGFAAAPSFYRRADGAIYAAIAAEEFDIVSPEASLKMAPINPSPGRYEFADADNLMAFARANAMQVRGHTLVWHRVLPDWVLETAADEREVHMREFITRVMTRYADDVDLWDVVNEPIADEGGGLRSSIWSDSMGERYIDIAFAQARALDPDAILVLNEFDIGFAGPKIDGLLALLDRLLQREVPVDAVGFQMHLFASYDDFDALADNFAAVAARGLDVHITELDVSLTDATDEQQQADVYQRVVEICLEQPRCTVIQTWGFTDRYSFRSIFDPLPFDADYSAKPAYSALQNALGG